MQELIFPCWSPYWEMMLGPRETFLFWSSYYSKSMVSSFHPSTGKSNRTSPMSHLSKLDMLTTRAESHWPSGILFYKVCLQGIFPVWTGRRKRTEKDWLRISMSTAENKGVSKISSGGPGYFSLKVTLGKGDSLNKKAETFHYVQNSQR